MVHLKPRIVKLGSGSRRLTVKHSFERVDQRPSLLRPPGKLQGFMPCLNTGTMVENMTKDSA